jgi:hypothetical protein
MSRAAVLLACACALTGCGIRNPDAPPPTKPHPNAKSAGGQPPPTGASPGPSTSGAAVLTAFATAYASTSRASVVSQQRTLVALATPALADQLRQHAAQAILDAQRAMPSGAQLTGHVISLQLWLGTTTRRGVIVIQQVLTRAGQALENPFTTVFLAVVTRAGTRWQVASFTPEP